MATKEGNRNNKKTIQSYKPASKKKSIKKKVNDNKNFELLYKAILILTFFVVFYAPYFRGLFFETEFLKTEIIVFILFALFSLSKLLKKERLELSTPLEYASLIFVIVYFISILASASLNLAVEEWLKYCMYFAVFFIISDIAANFRNRIRLLWVITASATGVCIIGIDAFAGNRLVGLLNNIFNRIYVFFGMDIPTNGTFFSMNFGGRLSSTLQYPNTLAAYLMAVYFIALGINLLTKSRIHKVISSVAGFIFFISLVFTLSRGAILILPLLILLFYIVLPKGYRVKGVIYSIVPLLASIPSIIKISGVFNSDPINGNPEIWIWIIPGVILSAALSFVANFMVSFFEKISWKVYIGIFSSLFIIAVIGMIVILNIREPLTIAFPDDLQANANIMRSVILEPGKDYTMNFNYSGNSQDIESDYEIIIYSNNEKEILRVTPRLIGAVAGKASQQEAQGSLAFTVPSDSKIQYVYFYNKTRSTDLVIYGCQIKDAANNQLVKSLPLKYKFIPELIVSRMQDLLVTKSSIERMVFYKNGLEMYKDHWLIGAGGSAWSQLYFAYQSYLYFSNQAHNYFIQTAIEAGIPGIIAVLFLVFSIIYVFIKQRYNKNVEKNRTLLMQTIIFTAVVTLIVHAVIDFDFTYPSMLILLWTLLAVFNAGARETETQAGGIKIPYLKIMKCNSAMLIVLAAVLIIRTIMTISALGYSTKGINELKANKIEKAIESFEKAAGLNPLKPDYKINYGNLVIQKANRTRKEVDKANMWMKESAGLAKNDVSLLPYISRYYFAVGDITKAIDTIQDTVSLRPFRPEDWEQLTEIHNSAWSHYNKTKDIKNADDIVNSALSAIPWAAAENKRNLDPFIFNSNTSQILEQLAYYKATEGNAEDSIAFFSLPNMDIDGNGVPDQWNTTLISEYSLKEENNMLRLDKIGNNADSFIQSRQLELKPNTKYKLEIRLDTDAYTIGMGYFIPGVSSQLEKLEFANGTYHTTFFTPETLSGCSLQLFPDSSCVIKDIRMMLTE